MAVICIHTTIIQLALDLVWSEEMAFHKLNEDPAAGRQTHDLEEEKKSLLSVLLLASFGIH